MLEAEEAGFRDQVNIEYPVKAYDSNVSGDAINGNEENKKESLRWRELKSSVLNTLGLHLLSAFPVFPVKINSQRAFIKVAEEHICPWRCGVCCHQSQGGAEAVRAENIPQEECIKGEEKRNKKVFLTHGF